VADWLNDRVEKFSNTGVFILEWGSNGSGDGQFDGPQGVFLDANDNAYVADSFNNRIEKFTSTGTFLTKWGSTGAGDGQFNSPFSVAVGSNGDVYVSDTNNNRVQKFVTMVSVHPATWGRMKVLFIGKPVAAAKKVR